MFGVIVLQGGRSALSAASKVDYIKSHEIQAATLHLTSL